MERVEDRVLAFVGAWVAGDDLGAAADHHSVDVAAHSRLPTCCRIASRPSRGRVPPRATGHATIQRDQADLVVGDHLLGSNGWQMEREQGIFGHAGFGALVARKESRIGNNFLRDNKDLRHVRHHNIGRGLNNEG